MAGDWRIIGHRPQVEWLGRTLTTGVPHHAYLIEGPDRVGKTTIALRMAQALECEAAPEHRPCLTCRACRKIEAGKHADVRLIGVTASDGEAPGHKAIRIAQVHELQHDAYLKPFEGRCRVVIVESAERLNREAANAFLKTLEEPPDLVVIVLLTTAPGDLPETIRSRCQAVRLSPVGIDEIRAGLERWYGATPELAAALARRAGGRVGWAVAAVADEDRFTADEELAVLMERLVSAPTAERLKEAETIAAQFQRDRFAVLDLLDSGRSWWRDVLVVALGCPELVLRSEMADRVAVQASQIGVDGALTALRALQDAIQHLEQNVQPRLALDSMALAFPAADR